MRPLLWKCAASAAALGGLLLVQPGNFAHAATQSQASDTRAAIRKCVTANQAARQAAQTQLREDLGAARNAAQDQRQAAVQAAFTKFQNAAKTAHDAFTSCIAAAKPSR